MTLTLSPRPSGTRTRTETAAAGSQVGFYREKGHAARFALSADSPSPDALANDEQLVVPNDMGAVEDVAATADRREVIDRIVLRVAVKMVDLELAYATALARKPIDRGTTAQTFMRAGAKVFIQEDSVFRNNGRLTRQWMTRRVDHPVPGSELVARLRACHVSALLGAEPTDGSEGACTQRRRQHRYFSYLNHNGRKGKI